MKTFSLTKHAIQRLIQRDINFAKQYAVITPAAMQKKFAYDYFYGSVEEKAFLNSSTFMTMLGERYGFDKKYRMFVRGDSLFVGMIDGPVNIIVTVLQRSGHYCRNICTPVKKFKIPKKEIRYEQAPRL